MAREAGALSVLPGALMSAAALRALRGDLSIARSMAAEAEAIARVIGKPIGRYAFLAIAAWHGREAEVTHLIAASMDEMIDRGQGEWLSAAEWASAVLYNGLGRYQEALVVAERASEQQLELRWATWSIAELIEAAVRAGKPARAEPALRRLSERARASESDWALGIEARSRALLSDGDAADRLYGEAVERLGRTHIRAELARAHLLYGEWLRRERRRVEPRTRCYRRWAWTGLPSVPGVSCRRPAKRSASAPSKRGTTSPRTRSRSPGWRARDARTPRSAASCS